MESVAEIGAYLRHEARKTTGTSVILPTQDRLFLGRVGPEQFESNFLLRIGTQFIGPDYAYFFAYPVRGRMVNGFQRRVADRDLEKVQAQFAAADPGMVGSKRVFPSIPEFDVGGWAGAAPTSLPSTRTEFYNTDPGVGWLGSFGTFDDFGNSTETYAPQYRAYTGQTRETWNLGVFGPSFPTARLTEEGVSRVGNTMLLSLIMHGDGLGRFGSATGTGSAVLYRDGTRFAETDQPFAAEIYVPPTESAYRLEATYERPARAALSTKVSAVWTFRRYPSSAQRRTSRTQRALDSSPCGPRCPTTRATLTNRPSSTPTVSGVSR